VSSLGKVIGPSVGKEAVAETIARLLDVYRERREEGEEFLQTVRRIGVEPFSERVYGTTH
jgi:sulfite reductase (NADPH) hemoprotein beta-component